MLKADYSVDCSSGTHVFVQLVASVIVLGLVGAPVALMVMTVRWAREHTTATEADRFVSRRVAKELTLDDHVAADAIRDVRLGQEYGSFLFDAYLPWAFYWYMQDLPRALI